LYCNENLQFQGYSLDRLYRGLLLVTIYLSAWRSSPEDHNMNGGFIVLPELLTFWHKVSLANLIRRSPVNLSVAEIGTPIFKGTSPMERIRLGRVALSVCICRSRD
jgi:hypothetical protein